jgi:hypothetical protein
LYEEFRPFKAGGGGGGGADGGGGSAGDSKGELVIAELYKPTRELKRGRAGANDAPRGRPPSPQGYRQAVHGPALCCRLGLGAAGMGPAPRRRLQLPLGPLARSPPSKWQ